MTITPHLFSAFLKCPTKCWFLARSEPPSANAFADWVKSNNETYRTAAVEKLRANTSESQISHLPAIENLKDANWRLAVDTVARAQLDSCLLESRLAAVEHIPAKGRGKPDQFVPVSFVFRNKLEKDDQLKLAFDVLLLSKILGRELSLGKIIHGDDHTTLIVKASAQANEVGKRIERLVALLTNPAPPELVLNRHCAECEFQARCRKIAVEKDDLSLLGGMSAKERQTLRAKGIFTITQLSYTFRPRRRPKRMRDKREKYHHSLKALAIQTKKIHVVGCPELKIDGTPVYLDVEGLPDRDFYYLIGARIGTGKSAVQHSLWADSIEDEERIWRKFLGILGTVEQPVLIHYGSYETAFLKRMCKQHGGPFEGSSAARAVQSAVNLITHIFAQIYFPGISNGLKDTAAILGFKWTETAASGLNTIAWRCQWERLREAGFKERLIRYNAQDCEGLNLVSDTIRRLVVRAEDVNEPGTPTVVRADADAFEKGSKWRKFISPVSGFEYINTAAHWSYQRDRVYARSGGVKLRSKKRVPRKKFFSRVEQIIQWESSCVCPKCNRRFCFKDAARSRTLQDVLFGRHSLKRRLVKYIFQTYRCRGCGTVFGVPERFQLCRRYGWNLVAYFFYQIVELYVPQLVVVQSFNRLFGFQLNRSTMNNLKIKAAHYYDVTRNQILEHLIRGDLIHADETRANIKGKSAFVWVLASFREVVYVYSASREGEIVQKLLADFKGVLVTDFYTAYDSIDCPQQKCLIHLMRDLNDQVLTHPFDEQLKKLVSAFGGVLKSAVETVDRFGLKKRFLQKHLRNVEHFYHDIGQTDCQSEAALKCKERLERNRDTLFTFLNYNGVPWNNNNAEHAVKAFARLRDVIAGSSTETGVDEYLTLLSLCQTCKYMGVDFLDFLRSGEKDVHAFAESWRGPRHRVGGAGAGVA